MSTLLIKNGVVVTASDTVQADVYVKDEQVCAIGRHLKIHADQVIDATGCYLFPGGVDAHTHMELPFMGTTASDTFETGTLAGLHGGTTTIIDFAIQTRGDSLTNALMQWHAKADNHAVGDYAFHLAVTDFSESARQEIQSIVETKGVSSFKTFMAYKDSLMLDDMQIVSLMEEVKKYGGMVTTHAENGDMADSLVNENRSRGNLAPKYHAASRPPEVEATATQRVLDLAYGGSHPLYIVHLTCEAALNSVRNATQRNQKAFIETCTQYLLLDESLYLQDNFDGAKYIMSPPLRKKKDRDALWAGINQNLIEVVASDHCPFCMEQKRMGKDDFSKIPNGGPGVENRMELLFSEGVLKNRISLNKYVELTATAPARIFGLHPQKGSIAVGSDADIVIFDPHYQHTISAATHHMNCDYNLYEGWQVTGKCRSTILRGTVAIDRGQAFIGKGFGKYIARKKVF